MARKKSPNGTGRKGRDKKKKALESEEYASNIQELAQRGIQAAWIEQIYSRCQERKQTMISKDTLAKKLCELLQYFEERNEGIDENHPAYLSSRDVVDMILRNPRLITMGIETSIIPKCQVVTSKKEGVASANMTIKSNPCIFNKSIDNIQKGK